jgi:hypothetical protein
MHARLPKGHGIQNFFRHLILKLWITTIQTIILQYPQPNVPYAHQNSQYT